MPIYNSEDYLKKLANEPIQPKVFKPREGQEYTRRELAAAIGIADQQFSNIKDELLKFMGGWMIIEEDTSSGKSIFTVKEVKKKKGFAYWEDWKNRPRET